MGLPRTAGWGYPEPYTRDLMIASLGMLVSGCEELIQSLRSVLETLAANQSPLGLIPSLVHEPDNLGASDTTPLFLIGLALYRETTGERSFLDDAARKALLWMEYQSPDDSVMVAQQPTSDWRDEQWVWGYGLYVNTLVYTSLMLHGQEERAAELKKLMNRFEVTGSRRHHHVHSSLGLKNKPYFALYSYKLNRSERFDLLGNSLAILSGLASPSRAKRLVTWIESECNQMRRTGDLVGNLPPCFFPYIRKDDPDWRSRYEEFNLPGEYHNGGIWPFICGFYVAALVAADRLHLAKKRLFDLTELVRPTREKDVAFGFNEWIRAQDGAVQGQDWQTWSAAMYLYAVEAVKRGETPYFTAIRTAPIV